MAIKNSMHFVVLFITFTVFSQDNLYSSLTIPKNLLKNANAVVRLNDVHVSLKSSSEMYISEKRIITVLNKQGNRNIGASVYYDNNIDIKELKVLVFDAFGKEIKKIKKKDFKDVSAVSGGTLYSDSRVKYLEYTPIKYPYTIEFYYETTSSNTAFIPSFIPLDTYYVSAETSTYTINYPESITIRKKEYSFKNIDIENKESENTIFYKIKNLTAFKPEAYSPSFRSIIPKVMFAANEFNYEGVHAKVEDWLSMGKWFYNQLLRGRSNIPEETKQEVLKLVEGVNNPIEKAKKVYQYVQDNTRYISVQVGIGGMQPIAAKEVDLVKYGDCKGLTNYTKALLDVVGVKSNYTRLYASPSNQISVDKDFVSFGGQTNHSALSYRERYNNANEDDFLEKLENKYDGLEISDFKVTNAVELSKPVMESYKFEKESQADLIGDKIYFSPLFFLCTKENPFKLEKREFPVDFGYPSSSTYRVTINLPEGYKVESVPNPIALALPDNLGAFKYNIIVKGQVIQLLVDAKINTPII